MSRRNSRKTENNTDWKTSDQKKLGSEAMIISVLKDKEPLSARAISKLARINLSTFYRHFKVLEKSRILKRVGDKFALWNYVENPWDRVKDRVFAVGGRLVSVEVEKLRLGKRDPVTGWCETIYDKKIVAEGAVINKGEKELLEAAKVVIPDNYNLAFLTNSAVDLGDRFVWQEFMCKVWNEDKIYQGNTLSYRVTYLVTSLNR